MLDWTCFRSWVCADDRVAGNQSKNLPISLIIQLEYLDLDLHYLENEQFKSREECKFGGRLLEKAKTL